MTISKTPELTFGFVPKKALRAWVPFLIYTLLIIQGAILRPNRIPAFIYRINDKLLHGLEFFLLFFLALNAFLGMRWRRSEAMAVIYCAFMGGLTEFLQLYVPGRSCDVKDWLADMAGTLFGLAIIASIWKVSGRTGWGR